MKTTEQPFETMQSVWQSMELLSIGDSSKVENKHVKANEVHVYIKKLTERVVPAVKVIIKHNNWSVKMILSDPQGYVKDGLAFKLDLHDLRKISKTIQKSNQNGWMVIGSDSTARQLSETEDENE